jgi:hypothetical protein
VLAWFLVGRPDGKRPLGRPRLRWYDDIRCGMEGMDWIDRDQEWDRWRLLVSTVVNQHSETNVMHFLFSLLRTKSLYMFRALLAHHQEALHKRHFVYCVRVMSVGCTELLIKLKSPVKI